MLVAGLQGLSEVDVIGNLQIIGNPRLQDISALDNFLECDNGMPKKVDPMAVLGVIQITPEVVSINGTSCLISTAEQARIQSLVLLVSRKISCRGLKRPVLLRFSNISHINTDKSLSH